MARAERPRRTQAQRTEETRAALVDATIRAIRDDGYRATTTRRVAEYAGVSLGAVAHHFPTRAALIEAALDEVAARVARDLEAEIGALAGVTSTRSRVVLDTLWRSLNDEAFLVWLRVWIAAAEDPDLRDAVLAADARMRALFRRILPPLAPPHVSPTDWLRRMNVAMDTIRGLNLVTFYQPRVDPPRDHWPAARRELVRMLEA